MALENYTEVFKVPDAYAAMCEQIATANAVAPQPRLIADERVPRHAAMHYYDTMGRVVVYFHPSLLEALPKREAEPTPLDGTGPVWGIPIERGEQ